MTAKEIAELIVTTADAKKAEDITVLRVGDKTTIADYFIIMTGLSMPHLRALSEEIEKKLDEKGVKPHHIEGITSNWRLMDYTSVLVHLFIREARELYALERLWGDAERIDISNLIVGDKEL